MTVIVYPSQTSETSKVHNLGSWDGVPATRDREGLGGGEITYPRVQLGLQKKICLLHSSWKRRLCLGTLPKVSKNLGIPTEHFHWGSGLG